MKSFKKNTVRAIALFMIVAVGGVSQAEIKTYKTTVREDFKENKLRSANNYYAYPDKDLPALTASPEGYEPFFINHYGRHGSRWLHYSKMYDEPLAELEKAHKLGKLTKRGKELLEVYRLMRLESKGREGELSDVGAEQHKGIGQRMARNFPEVFRGNARVDAKSTVVGRCILSMQNEVDQIKARHPGIYLTLDASEHDMYYMNNWRDVGINAMRDTVAPIHREFEKKHVKPDKFLRRIFDSKYIRDSIKDKNHLMLWIFDGIGNMQSHHVFDKIDMWNLFTADECYEIWRYNNVRWYLTDGDAPDNGNRIVYFNNNLLRDFIEKADQAIISRQNGAALRFGHESVLMPLACLMGIDGTDYQTRDMETLENHWRGYNIFPMACNIQLVFYRPVGDAQGEILVKALLNEREVTLPIETTMFPYYSWSELREYYLQKLSRQPVVEADYKK